MTDDVAPETVSISEDEKWSDAFNDKCIGYFPFTKIFEEMGIYDFLRQKSRNLGIQTPLLMLLNFWCLEELIPYMIL